MCALQRGMGVVRRRRRECRCEALEARRECFLALERKVVRALVVVVAGAKMLV